MEFILERKNLVQALFFLHSTAKVSLHCNKSINIREVVLLRSPSLRNLLLISKPITTYYVYTESIQLSAREGLRITGQDRASTKHFEF